VTVKNEALLPLFDELKALLEAHGGALIARRDEPGSYDLWSEKDLVIEGRRRAEVFFAGLVVRKTYVGFYFMPVYAAADLRAVFGPELLATLRGKSCFHIKRLTPTLREQIEEALAAGYRLYEERAWV